MAEREGLGRLLPSWFLQLSTLVHVAGVASLVAAPQHWRAIAGVVLADHFATVGAGLWPRSRLLGPNRRRLSATAARAGHVALTFDDGPDPKVTPKVLDQLDKAGAKATFFAIGRRVEEHSEIAAEIVRRGHQVENHTYRHSNAFSLYGPWAMAREIDRAQDAIERATGRRPRLFRAPAGLRNVFLEPLLYERGLELVSWTRRGFDTIDRRPTEVLVRLVYGMNGGDILVLHDGSAARDRKGRPVVLQMLPQLLELVTAQRLKSVVLPAPGSG